MGDLLATEESAVEYALQGEDSNGLPGGTVQPTHKNGEYRRILDEPAASSAVLAAEECPHGHLELLLLAHRYPKGLTGQRALAHLELTAGDQASWIVPYTTSILFNSLA